MPLQDGTVAVEGLNIESHILSTSTLFPVAVLEARYDVTELSISSYLLQVPRGTSAYTDIPRSGVSSLSFFTRGSAGIAHLRYLKPLFYLQ